MDQCKQCGADLQEGAKFCFQCGAPAHPAGLAPAGPRGELEFVQPALAGGMFLGILSSLPLLQAGNCLCCMWVVAGGGIATILLMRQRPEGISYGDGAFAGVLSGLIGAAIATLISIPVQIIQTRFFGSQQEAFEQAMKDVPGFEGPMRDLMMRMAGTEISAVTITLRFFTNLLVFALFAMIGGILAIAIVNKRKGAGMNPRPNIQP